MVHANTPVASLLLKNWPDLVIESLNVPEELSLLMSWTQSPASTENVVGQLLERSNPSDDVFKSFLKSAMTSVERMRSGFQAKNLASIQDEIQVYRQLLLELSRTYQLNIETKELTQFIERSEEHTSELQSRFDLVCRLLLEKK